MPVERLKNGSWPHPARLPLGGGWSGHCTAPGHVGAIPEPPTLETLCNLGYADRCSWAPSERAWDAVRFAVCAPAEFDRSEDVVSPARVVTLRYVCERNHLPMEHGDLEIDLGTGRWLNRHQDPRVQKMAECFLESYLNKHARKEEL